MYCRNYKPMSVYVFIMKSKLTSKFVCCVSNRQRPSQMLLNLCHPRSLLLHKPFSNISQLDSGPVGLPSVWWSMSSPLDVSIFQVEIVGIQTESINFVQDYFGWDRPCERILPRSPQWNHHARGVPKFGHPFPHFGCIVTTVSHTSLTRNYSTRSEAPHRSVSASKSVLVRWFKPTETSITKYAPNFDPLLFVGFGIMYSIVRADDGNGSFYQHFLVRAVVVAHWY